MEFVDLVYASKNKRAGAAYYRAQRLVEALMADLNLGYPVYKTIDASLDFPVTAPFDLQRSALVETSKGEFIGMIGELKNSVQRAFKLPTYCAAATLDLNSIQKAASNTTDSYTPLPRFPKVTQDITLQVPSDLNYQELFKFCWAELEKVQPDQTKATLSPLGIFQKQDDKSHKNITFRLTISSYEHTLTDAEVTKLLDVVAAEAKTKLQAERV
jgi:phenylalanyl-tRNA synthetase beta subunit